MGDARDLVDSVAPAREWPSKYGGPWGMRLASSKGDLALASDLLRGIEDLPVEPRYAAWVCHARGELRLAERRAEEALATSSPAVGHSTRSRSRPGVLPVAARARPSRCCSSVGFPRRVSLQRRARSLAERELRRRWASRFTPSLSCEATAPASGFCTSGRGSRRLVRRGSSIARARRPGAACGAPIAGRMRALTCGTLSTRPAVWLGSARRPRERRARRDRRRHGAP